MSSYPVACGSRVSVLPPMEGADPASAANFGSAGGICWTPQEVDVTVRSIQPFAVGRQPLSPPLASPAAPSRGYMSNSACHSPTSSIVAPSGGPKAGGSKSFDKVLPPQRILRVLAGVLQEHAWPLTWDQVGVVAAKVGMRLRADQELMALLLAELAALGPRYRPFSGSAGDREVDDGGSEKGSTKDGARASWSRSPGALSKCRATGLHPDEFASLFSRAMRRLGSGSVPQSPDGKANINRLLQPEHACRLTDKYKLLGKTLRVGRLGVVRLCQLRGAAGAFGVSSVDHVLADAGIAKSFGIGAVGGAAPGAGGGQAEQTSVCRSVSRELVDLNLCGQPAGRVWDDVESLRVLSHPHVARLQDALEDEDHLHLLYERVDGCDLHTALRQASLLAAAGRRGHGISECWVASLVLQLSLAVAYCHSQRVIHRNLTLRKVMLQGFSGWSHCPSLAGSGSGGDSSRSRAPAMPPKVVLLDAGLTEALVPAHCASAKVVSTERPYGTPFFMAPEVFNREYGPGCDVWSIGVIAFAMMSGRFPFEAEDGEPADVEDLVTGAARPAVPASHASEEAAGFCAELLRKDDACRPRALEASENPWFRVARERPAVLPRDLYNHIVDLC